MEVKKYPFQYKFGQAEPVVRVGGAAARQAGCPHLYFKESVGCNIAHLCYNTNAAGRRCLPCRICITHRLLRRPKMNCSSFVPRNKHRPRRRSRPIHSPSKGWAGTKHRPGVLPAHRPGGLPGEGSIRSSGHQHGCPTRTDQVRHPSPSRSGGGVRHGWRAGPWLVLA